ncbi:LytR/AlgR family response regulator transcription factor [Bizionia paragorgiae]|uniref:LytR/AlgR family response regulator transcription factor n=1 Tax=Bizionia paragorgiae TaxID=283786 RepID=UPI003A94935F
MYKILLIEDEAPARKKLKRYLAQVCPNCSILAELETVEDAILFLEQHKDVDLVFSDIELRDGNVFEVYDKVTLHCPIIFATAYNAFLMDAFDANGIAYLLKPYSLEQFTKAWNKFLRLRETTAVDYNQLMGTINQLLENKTSTTKPYKDQFAIKSSQEIYFLKVDAIVYFKAENGVVFAFDNKNKRHLMPQTALKEIETLIDPNLFFRINRSECVQRTYINKVKRYDKNTVALYLNGDSVTLKTSQNRTSDFNLWLDI